MQRFGDGAPVDYNIPEDLPLTELKDILRRFANGQSGSICTFTACNPETFAAAQSEPESYNLIRVRKGGWTEFLSRCFLNIRSNTRGGRSMSNFVLPAPLRRSGSLQPGVTDPVWPSTPPPDVDSYIYREQYAGQLVRQRYLHLVTANVSVSTLAELDGVPEKIAHFAEHQMERGPVTFDRREYDPPAENRRVSVTLGIGANLFTTQQGDDRFGLAAIRPTWLKLLEPIPGDAASFSPRDYSTDLIFLLAWLSVGSNSRSKSSRRRQPVAREDELVSELIVAKVIIPGYSPIEAGYPRTAAHRRYGGKSTT